MKLSKLWRDKDKRGALIDLIGLGAVLFGKGNRGSMISKIMEKAEMLADFRMARDMIDKAEANSDGVALSEDQAAALDQFLDLTSRPKRELRRLLK